VAYRPLQTIYRLVSVSGRVLRLVNDSTLPEVVPTVVTGGHVVTVPALSFGFVVIPDARAAACISWHLYYYCPSHRPAAASHSIILRRTDWHAYCLLGPVDSV